MIKRSLSFKRIIITIISVVSFVIIISLAENGISDFFLEIFGIGLATLILTKGVSWIFDNIDYLKTLYEIWKKDLWDKDIRLSISYLIQIDVKNNHGITQYLLVPNSRTNGFQPVGGVYKYYNETQIKKLHARPATQFHKENDFRLLLKGRHLIKFISYFKSGKNRETSFEREFKEELLDTRILNANIFSSVKFEHLRQDTTGLRYSDYFQCYEVLIYDIIVPHFTEEQKRELEQLVNHPMINIDFRLVSEDLIKSKGHSRTENKDLFKLQEHTKRIL